MLGEHSSCFGCMHFVASFGLCIVLHCCSSTFFRFVDSVSHNAGTRLLFRVIREEI
jgi:hypothetical protein